MFWHHAIEAVGAGLATVLGNLQVIIVGFFAWLLLGERPSRATLLALPVVLAGVILISGVVGAGAYGAAPQLGVILGIATAFCYSAYLLHHPARRPRSAPSGRTGGDRHGPGGGLRASWSGEATGDLDLTPPLAEPVLAGAARDHLAVGRLPADLDLAAAAAGDHHLGHPAGPAGHVDGPGHRAARRGAVGDPAARRRPGDRRDRGGDMPVGRLRDGWQRARPSPTSN